MREPQFDRLRSEVGDAVRQPDFNTVRGRAGKVRRRRAITSAAALLATVLGVTGLGYAVQAASNDRGLVDSAPPATEGPGGVWFPSPLVTNAGTNLYRVFERCRECDAELYVSSNGGESWQRRPRPPAPNNALGPREASLVALAPGLVLWREHHILTATELASASGNPSGHESPAYRPWITRDGGMTWQQAAVDTQPVAAVPDGVRPVDCVVVDVPTCRIGVIDPVTGRFAPLAAQPTGITVQERWTDETNVPLDGLLWVPGLDPVTNKPAVATSSDAGRTWHTHVFSDAVTAVSAPDGTTATMYLPKVAAGSGKAAYVLTHRAGDVLDAHYTTDGGLTWRNGDTIRNLQHSAGFVAADGSHIVATDTGLVAGRGTGRYAPVTLPGYPADPAGNSEDPGLTQVASRQATVPYLVNSDKGPYLSEDGRTWRRVRLP